MSNVPDGWEMRTLGDLGRYLNGRAFKSSDWGTEGRPIVRIQNLTGSGNQFNYFAGAVEDRYIVRPGDLLVSWAATLGAYFWNGPEGVLNQHIFKVESNIDKRFHKYLIESKIADMLSQTHGSGMVHITKSKFDAIPVAVPPLDEQQRIVAMLEDHLSRLDAADRALAIALDRTSVLQRKAMTSLLDQDGDLLALSDLLSLSIGGLWGEASGQSENDVKVIRVTELSRLGDLDPATAASRSVTKAQYMSRSLRAGDLLLEKSGGGPMTPVGRVGLVREWDEPMICANFMQLMRPDTDRVIPRWLHLYLNGFYLAGRTTSMQKASTNIRNIKASEYVKIAIRVPSLRRQVELVNQCEELLAEAGRMNRALQVGLRQSAALRRSLLTAAFSGQLTKEPIGV